MRCDLPLAIGDTCADVVAFEREDSPSFLYIAMAVKRASDVAISWPRGLPGPEDVDEALMPFSDAVEMVRTANKHIKEPHIKSRCQFSGNVDADVRDMLLSLRSAGVLHPAALPAKTDAAVVRARAALPYDEQGGELRIEAGGEYDAAVLFFRVPLPPHILSLPCPHPLKPNEVTMNATIIVIGDAVHESFDDSGTFRVPNKGATITYIPMCEKKLYPRGLYYARPTLQLFSAGREMVHLNGVHVTDSTELGLVRCAQYQGTVMPLVCGCPIINRVRFERALIPFALVPSMHGGGEPIVFRDAPQNNGSVEVSLDGIKTYGTIDVRNKEKHGEIYWVTML